MLNTVLNKLFWLHGGEQREERQQSWEAPSAVLMRNYCSWDSSDGRGKRRGWLGSLRFVIVSEVYEKTKGSNLMSNGRNTKDSGNNYDLFWYVE